MGNSQIGKDEFARALYAEHSSALPAYVRRLVGGDRQLAEDVLQETLIRACRVRPTEYPADELDALIVSDGIDQALDVVTVTGKRLIRLGMPAP